MYAYLGLGPCFTPLLKVNVYVLFIQNTTLIKRLKIITQILNSKSFLAKIHNNKKEA